MNLHLLHYRLLLCHWHVYRAVRPQIRKYVAKEEFQEVSKLFLRCMKANTEVALAQTMARLRAVNSSFTEYFDKNWYPCLQKWASCFRRDTVLFKNDTNNRIESANRRLKLYLNAQTPLVKALTELLHMEEHAYNERCHREIQDIRVKSNYPYSKSICYFLNSITTQSAKVLVEHLDSCTFRRNKELAISDLICYCAFSIQWLLPCEHIFMRKRLDMDALISQSRKRKKRVSFNSSLSIILFRLFLEI